MNFLCVGVNGLTVRQKRTRTKSTRRTDHADHAAKSVNISRLYIEKIKLLIEKISGTLPDLKTVSFTLRKILWRPGEFAKDSSRAPQHTPSTRGMHGTAHHARVRPGPDLRRTPYAVRITGQQP